MAFDPTTAQLFLAQGALVPPAAQGAAVPLTEVGGKGGGAIPFAERTSLVVPLGAPNEPSPDAGILVCDMAGTFACCVAPGIAVGPVLGAEAQGARVGVCWSCTRTLVLWSSLLFSSLVFFSFS